MSWISIWIISTVLAVVISVSSPSEEKTVNADSNSTIELGNGSK